MEYFVLATLFVALVAYCVTGGADFGVGILEMLSEKSQRPRIRELSEKAIAPIWEANHVWIVLILVILFVGFPNVHTRIVISMHVPLLIMLVGIVLRGAAFTFRYYDVVDDPASEKLWTWLFRAGSLLVPLSFGAIAAALHAGTIPQTETTVFASYIAPWCTWFSLLAGLFTAALFAWIASVYLCGEVLLEEDDACIARWKKRSRRFQIVCVLLGGMTSVCALWQGALSVPQFLGIIPILSLLLTSVAASYVFVFVGRRLWSVRIAVIVASAGILSGYWLAHFPVAIAMQEHNITWHESVVSTSSLRALTLALGIGLVAILPSLAALYRVFKMPSQSS